MVQLSRSFFLLSLFAAALSNPLKRTVAQVEADLTAISTQVTALDTAINGFPASGLAGALAIHSDAQTLVTTINSATSDVTSTGPVDDADGNTILGQVEGFAPTIQDALTKIVADKAAFAALPIAGIPALVLQDLINLNASTVAFGDALIANAPADLKPTATSLEAGIASALATAIAAYQ